MKSRKRSVLTLLVMLTIIQCALTIQTNPLGGEKKRREQICDSDVCSCKSDTQITVTCSCLGALVQEFELTGKYSLHPNTHVFKVENCQKLSIPSDVFSQLLHIRELKFENISQLVIAENSFRYKVPTPHFENNPPDIFPQEIDGITITVANSSIPEVPNYAFRGRLTKIHFNHVHIDKISSFAFTDLCGTTVIELRDVDVTSFEPQAFKKFTVENLILSGGNYSSIPSLTMKDIIVTESFEIQRITVGQLASSAFVIESPKTTRISDSRFTRIEGEALKIVTRGSIYIENNVFISLGAGAFLGITVEDKYFEKYQLQKLYYKNNNMTQFSTNSLMFNTSRVTPVLVKVIVNQSCKCESIEQWSNQLSVNPPMHLRNTVRSEWSEEIFCLLENKSSTDCINFRNYEANNCGIISSNTHMLLIIIISSSVLLLLIGVVVICICQRRRTRQQRWTNVPTSEHKKLRKTSNVQGSDSRITMVVPDGRTYRETELHVIVEQTEPIADQHIYQNVQNKPTKNKQPVPLPRSIT